MLLRRQPRHGQELFRVLEAEPGPQAARRRAQNPARHGWMQFAQACPLDPHRFFLRTVLAVRPPPRVGRPGSSRAGRRRRNSPCQ